MQPLPPGPSPSCQTPRAGGHLLSLRFPRQTFPSQPQLRFETVLELGELAGQTLDAAGGTIRLVAGLCPFPPREARTPLRDFGFSLCLAYHPTHIPDPPRQNPRPVLELLRGELPRFYARPHNSEAVLYERFAETEVRLQLVQLDKEWNVPLYQLPILLRCGYHL
jgi:hypothetical protein